MTRWGERANEYEKECEQDVNWVEAAGRARRRRGELCHGLLGFGGTRCLLGEEEGI